MGWKVIFGLALISNELIIIPAALSADYSLLILGLVSKDAAEVNPRPQPKHHRLIFKLIRTTVGDYPRPGRRAIGIDTFGHVILYICLYMGVVLSVLFLSHLLHDHKHVVDFVCDDVEDKCGLVQSHDQCLRLLCDWCMEILTLCLCRLLWA